MVDVFISYSREDEGIVRLLAEQMGQRGLDVWWDRKLLPGKDFDREIEKMIEQARTVVVVWTVHSVESRWVRTEASEALDLMKLVPLRLDDCRIPLEFKRIQTADLSGWKGDARNDQLAVLTESLKAFCAATDGNQGKKQPSVQEAGGWQLKNVKFGWSSVAFDLVNGSVTRSIEYKNCLSYEVINIDGVEACRGGSYTSQHPFFQFYLRKTDGASICIVEPVYSTLSKYLTVRLTEAKVSIDGVTLAKLTR